MKYVYFVTYMIGPSTIGRCEVVKDAEVTSIDHVRDMEKVIEEKYSSNDVIVTNFVLLRREYDQ